MTWPITLIVVGGLLAAAGIVAGTLRRMSPLSALACVLVGAWANLQALHHLDLSAPPMLVREALFTGAMLVLVLDVWRRWQFRRA